MGFPARYREPTQPRANALKTGPGGARRNHKTRRHNRTGRPAQKHMRPQIEEAEGRRTSRSRRRGAGIAKTGSQESFSVTLINQLMAPGLRRPRDRILIIFPDTFVCSGRSFASNASICVMRKVFLSSQLWPRPGRRAGVSKSGFVNYYYFFFLNNSEAGRASAIWKLF